MTQRSFIPAQCVYPYTVLNDSWYDQGAIKITYPPTTSFFSPTTGMTQDNCRFSGDIINGKYNGHPDFEADYSVFSEGCSGVYNNLTSIINWGQPCSLSSKPLTKIVEFQLTNSIDGLPKPQYCGEGGNTPRQDGSLPAPGNKRCGWRNTGYSGPGGYVVSTGQENFDKWYRDYPVYNMRQGNILTLTSIGNGQFQFSSYTNPNSNFPGFHPMKSPCGVNTTTHTVLCSPGQNSFPLLNKISYDEYTDPNHYQFSFTTEIHTFFELNGNESFTFSGDDDVFIFVNERLAVDVGGLHSRAQSSISLGNPA